MARPKLTKEIALARYEMFTEAAEHLQGDITEANYWLNKASELPETS